MRDGIFIGYSEVGKTMRFWIESLGICASSKNISYRLSLFRKTLKQVVLLLSFIYLFAED